MQNISVYNSQECYCMLSTVGVMNASFIVLAADKEILVVLMM